MNGVFVTGTGTEVGKTVVACEIASEHAAAGKRVSVFKPVVTGLHEPGAGDVERLRAAAASDQADDEVAPYRYGPAVSPHLAADLAGEKIDPARLLAGAALAAGSADFLVCEGVGGFLVPLSPGYLVRDFAADLGLPVVIAASPELGTINHTLLTIEAVRATRLELDSVVLTPWPERPSAMHESNRETIAATGGVEVRVLPRLAPQIPVSLSA